MRDGAHDGNTVPLDEATRAEILARAETMAGEGIRVLGVASKTDADLTTAEEDMTFLGLVGLLDPSRPEVADSIGACRSAWVSRS